MNPQNVREQNAFNVYKYLRDKHLRATATLKEIPNVHLNNWLLQA